MDEIMLFRRLKQEFPNSVRLALQAYLKRTYNDIKTHRSASGFAKGFILNPKRLPTKRVRKFAIII